MFLDIHYRRFIVQKWIVLFLYFNSGPEKIIAHFIRNRPENMFTTPHQGIDLLSSGKFAYVAVKIITYNLQTKSIGTLNKRCHIIGKRKTLSLSRKQKG